jgi:nitrite reductase (NADH) large subunit
VLYGDTLDGVWYQELLESKTNISAWRDILIFGKSYAKTAQ